MKHKIIPFLSSLSRALSVVNKPLTVVMFCMVETVVILLLSLCHCLWCESSKKCPGPSTLSSLEPGDTVMLEPGTRKWWSLSWSDADLVQVSPTIDITPSMITHKHATLDINSLFEGKTPSNYLCRLNRANGRRISLRVFKIKTQVVWVLSGFLRLMVTTGIVSARFDGKVPIKAHLFSRQIISIL